LRKKQLTIIEEPERNIHSYLNSKVVEMMKDVLQKKQIIVTTHNPENTETCRFGKIFNLSHGTKKAFLSSPDHMR
jgi:predicted ATPase